MLTLAGKRRLYAACSICSLSSCPPTQTSHPLFCKILDPSLIDVVYKLMFLFMFQKLVLNVVETANDEEAELVKKHQSETPNFRPGVDPQEYCYINLHGKCVVVIY